MHFGLDKPVAHLLNGKPTHCEWCTGLLKGLRNIYKGAGCERYYCSQACLTDGEDRAIRYRAQLAGRVCMHWTATLAAILSVLMVIFIFTGGKKAWAHEHYSDWKVPGTNGSCCNERIEADGKESGDCEVAPFEVRSIQGTAVWYVYIRQVKQWIVVPEMTLLREKNPDPAGIDGHVCWTLPKGVICARPPTGAL